MEWTDQELDELAAFFAKRLTTSLSPLDPTDPPPPGNPATPWRTKLGQARDRGRLPSLAREIAAAMPDDANLQQACSLLQGPGGRNSGQLAGWAMALSAVLVLSGITGAAGLVWLSQGAPVAPLEASSAAVAVRVEAEPTPIPDPDQGRIGSDEAPEPAVQVEVLSARAVEPEGEDAAPEPPAQAPRAVGSSGQRPTERCAGEDGQVVGYWYAGSKKPGRTGSRITLDKTVNVRADYPDVHNNFEKKAAVQCVLMAGDKVKLRQSAIEVPGNAWWVPLVAGSVEAG